MAKSCYMCNKPATSKEHVPPKCIFPDPVTYGEDLRKNLISVPSCDEHNQLKSEYDVIFRGVLTMAIGANRAGKHQFFGKNLRAVTKSRRLFQELIRGKGELASGKLQAVQISRPHFDLSVQYMARALYFHTYGEKWFNEVRVFSPMFFDGIVAGRPVPNSDTANLVETAREILGGTAVQGDNQEVFKYRIVRTDDSAAFAMAALFYESFELFAVAVADPVTGVSK